MFGYVLVYGHSLENYHFLFPPLIDAPQVGYDAAYFRQVVRKNGSPKEHDKGNDSHLEIVAGSYVTEACGSEGGNSPVH